jgi:WD40 repeat protein
MTHHNEPYQLAHQQHKVPVTSLEFYSNDLLLAGEGTYLVAYSTSRKIRLGSIQVFRSQAIHRILINEATKEILVCGGSYVAFAELHSDSDDDGDLVTFTILAVQDVGDWIFSAAFSPPSVDDSAATVALVTAHNALIKCSLDASQDDEREWNLSTKTFVPGSNCILYCAHISWLSTSVCLVASGTAFGDIIVWSTPFNNEKRDTANVKTHYIFQAHEGSVFDVQISTLLQQSTLQGPQRVLASCSDDRTIRLWDISDFSCESPSMTDIQRETGFGSTDQSNTYAPPLLSTATGHISRIWMVRFILEETNDGSQGSPERKQSLAIASFGEDGSCITWNIETFADDTDLLTYELRQLRSLPIHTGKNIWSSSVYSGHGATGGADGLIALLPSVKKVPQEFDIDKRLLYPSSDEPSTGQKDIFRSYTFVDASTVMATTTDGQIVTLTLEQDGTSVVTRHGAYESLSSFSMTTSGQGLAFVAGIKGEVLMFAPRYDRCFSVAALSRKVAGLFLSALPADTNYDAAERHDLLVTTVGSTAAQLVNIHKTTNSDGAEIYEPVEQLLTLPPRFVVTSFVTVQQDDTRYAILGSRGGSLAIYNLTNPASSETIAITTLLQNSHAKESITALHWKPATTTTSNPISGHLFSTSRDSTLAIHTLTLHPSSPFICLIHQLELPFGPNIEGLTFIPNNNNETNTLQVWGFKGKTFVSHSLATHQDVFTVECGGGVHRNWAFEPSDNGGTFIWTQNGSLKRVTQTEKPLRTVRAGGHGREIKAVAVSNGEYRIIATGAEDTDIKLSTYEDGSGFECLQTLRKHNTGIQHLQWSKDGRRLFSSGGSEEFYVWQVCHGVPVLGVGVLCESKHPRSMMSDLRIMGFEAREREEDGFEVVMAYSDSSVKVWGCDCGEWVLRREGDYLTACLTDVMFVHGTEGSLSGDQHQLLTTAMDGHVAMWQCLEDKRLAWLQRRQVHQNAILDSTATTLSDDTTLLLTAGDDNALGLSRIDVKNEISTLLIPRAHAAAVTALAVFKYGDDSFYVLSASIDQRVKLWDVRIDVTVPGVEDMQVRKVQNVFSSVADVSSMALLRLEDGSTGVLVCGVGMDVWRLEDTPPTIRI